MIICLYGRLFTPFVEPVVQDLHAAAAALNGELLPISIEQALAERVKERTRWVGVRRIYVLPFDVPATLPAGAPTTPAAMVRWLFPGAEVLNAFDAHEICWDKPTLVERWLQRGVRVPDSVLTSSVEEATAFVQQHEWVLLKAAHACGGHGHYLVAAADDGLVAEARGQRYELELVPPGARAQIRDRGLIYPGPFLLQRLVAEVGARGVLTPGQLLRAYFVDGQIMFWIERYREHYRRPSDWIVGASSGAKYRFLFGVAEEARKVAMRAAEVIGLTVGVVDLIRTATEGAYALAAYTDGHHMMIDREFKRLPEFRDAFDFDRVIVEALLAEPASGAVHKLASEPVQPAPPRSRGRVRRDDER